MQSGSCGKGIGRRASGCALAGLLGAWATVGAAATLPEGTGENIRRPVFSHAWGLCAAPDYLAIDGQDDWLPNRETREKLVIITWRSGLVIKTKILGRGKARQGLRCNADQVDLLTAEPGETLELDRYAIGTDIKELPSISAANPDSSAALNAYKGLGPDHVTHLGARGYASLIRPLGMTTNGQSVVLVMKNTGLLEPGSGYTSAESIKVTVGQTQSSTLVIEQSDNFEPAD